MKKISLFVIALFGTLSSLFSQNPFCDSIATATVSSDVAYAREVESIDSALNHYLFEQYQSIIDTTPSQASSQLVIAGKPVTFIDAIGTFPDLTQYGYDYHLWDRAYMGCPALVQGENDVVIRLRYKAW